ncbi:hypothetical protein MJT46_006408 [Ovis ammon polii x Ovis aries]|nr:hypothetical protein MJT46_006408 [Ovis ammon polii x Ovis aries]
MPWGPKEGPPGLAFQPRLSKKALICRVSREVSQERLGFGGDRASSHGDDNDKLKAHLKQQFRKSNKNEANINKRSSGHGINIKATYTFLSELRTSSKRMSVSDLRGFSRPRPRKRSERRCPPCWLPGPRTAGTLGLAPRPGSEQTEHLLTEGPGHRRASLVLEGSAFLFQRSILRQGLLQNCLGYYKWPEAKLINGHHFRNGAVTIWRPKLRASASDNLCREASTGVPPTRSSPGQRPGRPAAPGQREARLCRQWGDETQINSKPSSQLVSQMDLGPCQVLVPWFLNNSKATKRRGAAVETLDQQNMEYNGDEAQSAREEKRTKHTACERHRHLPPAQPGQP